MKRKHWVIVILVVLLGTALAFAGDVLQTWFVWHYFLGGTLG